jgi:hypothetical protein
MSQRSESRTARDLWEPTAGANTLRFSCTDPDPAGPSLQVKGSPFDSLRPGPTPDSCLGVKGSPVQIRPSRLVVKFFRIYLCPREPAKEPSPGEMAPLKARADRLPRRPTRASDNTAQPAKPTAKGPKITEPPRISTATPDNCEPPGTIPGCPANRKPDAHRPTAAAGRGQASALKAGLPTPP